MAMKPIPISRLSRPVRHPPKIQPAMNPTSRTSIDPPRPIGFCDSQSTDRRERSIPTVCMPRAPFFPICRSAALQTLLEEGLHPWPLLGEDRVVDRVAQVAIGQSHVAAEDALAHRAKPLDGSLRAQVAPIGLQGDA